MGVVIVLLVLAVLFGVLGLVIKGLLWLLIIAAVLVAAAFIAGRVRGGTRRSGAGV